jgi:hypothetical protein
MWIREYASVEIVSDGQGLNPTLAFMVEEGDTLVAVLALSGSATGVAPTWTAVGESGQSMNTGFALGIDTSLAGGAQMAMLTSPNTGAGEVEWTLLGDDYRGILAIYAVQSAGSTTDDTDATFDLGGTDCTADLTAEAAQELAIHAFAQAEDSGGVVGITAYDGTADDQTTRDGDYQPTSVGHKLLSTTGADTVGPTRGVVSGSPTYDGGQAGLLIAADAGVTYPDPTFDEAGDVDPWDWGWFTADSTDALSDDGTWPAEWVDSTAIPVRGLQGEVGSKFLIVVAQVRDRRASLDMRFGFDYNGGAATKPPSGGGVIEPTPYVTEPEYPTSNPNVGELFVQAYEWEPESDTTGNNGILWVDIDTRVDRMLVAVLNIEASAHNTSLRTVRSKGWRSARGPALGAADEIGVTATATAGFIFSAYAWNGTFVAGVAPESAMDEEAKYVASDGALAFYSGGAEAIDDYVWGAALNQDATEGFGIAVFIPPAGYTGETDPEPPPPDSDESNWMRNRFRQVGSQARRSSGLIARGM